MTALVPLNHRALVDCDDVPAVDAGVRRALGLPGHVAAHVMRALITPMDAEWPPNLDPHALALRNEMWSSQLARYPEEVLAQSWWKVFRREGVEPKDKRFPPKFWEVEPIVKQCFAEHPKGKMQERIAAFHSHFDVSPHTRRRFNGNMAGIDPREWHLVLERLRNLYTDQTSYRFFLTLRSFEIDTTSERCPMPLSMRREYGLPCTPDELEQMAPDGQKPSQLVEQERQRRVEVDRKAKEERAAEDRYRHWVRFHFLFDERKRWRLKLMVFKGNGHWGNGDVNSPKPGEPGSFAPPELQREFGFEPHQSTIDYWTCRDSAGDAFVDDPRFTDPIDECDCRLVLARLTA